MRTDKVVTAAAVGMVILASAAIVGRAGPLDPPAGPVAGTYKTLTEVEPRIAVNATNTPGDTDALFKISAPGSYYLTGNITGVSGKHGIEIAAQGVTLDLMGFTVQGVGGSLSGVFMGSFRENVVICNGHVRDWDQSGINARIDLGRIERITASENGGWGIDNGAGTFTAHIVSCESFHNGHLVADTGGIRGSARTHITDSIAAINTGDGIDIALDSLVIRCIARANSGDGIAAAAGCKVVECLATNNAGDGIQCSGDGYIERNSCSDNAEAGIHAGTGNRIEANNCAGNARGIDVDVGGNLILRNSARGNSSGNYDIASGNITATIVTTEGALNAAANANVNISF